MEMENTPEGSREEVKGLALDRNFEKEGVRGWPSSLRRGRERKSHVERELVHMWSLNPCEYGEMRARLSEKREHVLMQRGLQNSQRGKRELVRDQRHTSIKNKPTHVYNKLHRICQGYVYLEVKVVIS